MPNKIYRFEANLTPTFPKTSGEETIIDLGVIDGNRYLSATDSVLFSDNFELLDLATEEGGNLKELIKRESPLCRQIDEDTIRKIRMKYALNDELKALRTGDIVYKEFIETIVQEGKDKKTELGL